MVVVQVTDKITILELDRTNPEVAAAEACLTPVNLNRLVLMVAVPD